MDALGFCPIPIVCAVNTLSKTKSAIAALSLIGNTHSFYSSLKERFIPRLCSRSTLPPVLDDIKKPKVIEDIAVAFYNKGKDGTSLLESTPRTCPMLTVNWKVLAGLGKDPRWEHTIRFRWLDNIFRETPYSFLVWNNSDLSLDSGGTSTSCLL